MASFRDFTFGAEEHALAGSYTDWRDSPSYDQAEILGSSRTDVTLLSVNSRRLAFETRLTRARFLAARAQIGQAGQLVDFEGDTTQALLLRLQPISWYYGSERTMRVRWEFIEQ